MSGLDDLNRDPEWMFTRDPGRTVPEPNAEADAARGLREGRCDDRSHYTPDDALAERPYRHETPIAECLATTEREGLDITLTEFAAISTPASSTLPWTDETQRAIQDAIRVPAARLREAGGR